VNLTPSDKQAALNLIKDLPATRERAREVISLGGSVGFRTDTFYGLGVDPFNAEAVTRLKTLKGRDDGKPILLLISDIDVLGRVIHERSDLFERVIEKFWPGPLTVVGVATADIPVEISAGTGTVGVRLPADETLRALVRICGGTLTATSANPTGSPPATTAAEVNSYFGGKVELIIDGGEVSVTQPSTVLDVTTSPPKLIREGAVTKEDFRAAGFDV
jgi:L-threonylcarbamoyladenylate synthase